MTIPPNQNPYGGGGGVTQGEVDATVTAAVDGLVDGAPALLDTLNELAAALGDDENFATTITGLIGDVNTALGNHETDTSDAHDASAISFVPTVDISSTDTQAGIAQAGAIANAAAVAAGQALSDPIDGSRLINETVTANKIAFASIGDYQVAGRSLGGVRFTPGSFRASAEAQPRVFASSDAFDGVSNIPPYAIMDYGSAGTHNLPADTTLDNAYTFKIFVGATTDPTIRVVEAGKSWSDGPGTDRLLDAGNWLVWLVGNEWYKLKIGPLP